MSSNSEVRSYARRFKVAEQRRALKRRDRAQLPFLDLLPSIPTLLLDTTVYIDELQGKFPANLSHKLASASLWHSTITECELSALIGRLDPAHPNSAQVIEKVMATIERRPAHRVANPDRETWCEAGIAAGLLARLQQYGKSEQRQALNDALLFFSAAKQGLTVLTRNISDFDFLLQLAPRGRVAFYDI